MITGAINFIFGSDKIFIAAKALKSESWVFSEEFTTMVEGFIGVGVSTSGFIYDGLLIILPDSTAAYWSSGASSSF